MESGHVCRVQESGLAIRDGATQDGMEEVVADIVLAVEILEVGGSGCEMDSGVGHSRLKEGEGKRMYRDGPKELSSAADDFKPCGSVAS